MIIIDDFIKDQQLLQEIQSDNSWEIEESVNRFYWKDSSDIQPRNPIEYLISSIWKSIKITVPIAGYEYWKHQFDPSQPVSKNSRYRNHDGTYWHTDGMSWHKDFDVALYKKQSVMKYPLIGSVYYAHKTLPVGGYLVVKRENGYMEWIEPKPNRVVIFESSMEHGVDKIHSGIRRAIVSNLWEEAPLQENFL